MDNLYKTTEARRNSIKKYQQEKTDRIEVRVPKGMKFDIQQYAEYRGKSVNALFNELILKEMNTTH